MRRRFHSVLSLQRRLLKSVLAVVRYPRLTLAGCGLVLAITVGVALTHLAINTDQDRLFSPQVGFFKDYLEFEQKFPENEALYVLIEPADKTKPPALSRWTELADRITDQLRGLKGVVESAQCRVPLDELGDYALLFEDHGQLVQSFNDAQEALFPLAGIWSGAASPMGKFLTGLSLSGVDAGKAKFITLLADSWTATIQQGKPNVPDLAALSADNPSDLGYTYVPDQTDQTNHLLLIQVYLADGDDSVSSEYDQVDAVRNAASEAAADFRDFHVGITGRPALDADEMRISDRDSTHAEIVALICVFIGLWVMLRSFWMAAAAEISLAVSIGWTFGWATISVGELNILSLVFLITLIGIGMDYLVQILMRYRREAQRYERPTAIWARVFRHVSPPICTACLGAAGAFFVSIFTDFRGASELGIIAGGGLLLCLAGGYTVLPALLTIFPPKLARVEPEARYAPAQPRRSAVRRLLPPAIWLLVLVIVLPFSRRIYFNPNLLDLQAKNLESVRLVRKLQTWSAVAMSRDLASLRQMRDAVAPSPAVASVESIVGAQDNYAWLKNQTIPKIAWSKPAPLSGLDLSVISLAAQALIQQLQSAHFTDAAESLKRFLIISHSPAALGLLSQWQSQFAAQLHGLVARFTPPPLDAQKLPAELRNHLVSSDGYYALYISPKENLWQRGPLEKFVLDVESRVQNIPNHPPITGIAPEIYHSTRSIELSFYKATGYALGLVLLLVFIDLRSIPQTLITVSVLGLGLPMLVGIMGWLGINWNFANFFGLPILIGAGHEYGVFMMHRYREAIHNPRRVWTSWDVSDRALLLCAYVTTSSFAFFWWLGHHEGLKSLGLVMALGIACIYLAALLVVRPVLKWRIDRTGHCNGRSGTKNEP
jgi:uncharacterized protein